MNQLFAAIESGDINAVEEILCSIPSCVNKLLYGETPLHIASAQSQIEIVQLLLNNGAEVAISGNNGRTALHYAAENGATDIAEMLIDQEAPLEIRNNAGFTPLLTAAYGGHAEVASLLIERGAYFDLVSAVALGRVDRAKALISQDANVVQRSPFQANLLADAVYAHNPALVELLLQHADINVNAVGSSGEPPLVAAVSRSDFSPEIVKMLVDQGADPHQSSSSGDDAYSRANSVGIDTRPLF